MVSWLVAATVLGQMPVVSPKDQAAAARVFTALRKRLQTVRTLSAYVVDKEPGGRNRWVRFPPPVRARDDYPKTVEDCFGIILNRWDSVSHVRYHGQKATMLVHTPADGADGSGVLYISDTTGWPLAFGYSVDRYWPPDVGMLEFKHLRVTLRRRK